MTSPRRVRAYTMGVRAETAAATHDAIVRAAIRLFGTRDFDDVSLADVADDAGVAVQTVLRRFGSKEGVVEAATIAGIEEVRRARWEAPPGDIDAAVHGLVAHYEVWGDRSLRFLAQEGRVPALRRVTDAGRALHHAWVDRVFASVIAGAKGRARARLRAQLVAATDVYVWKIVRRDLGFGVREAEATMRELVAAVCR